MRKKISSVIDFKRIRKIHIFGFTLWILCCIPIILGIVGGGMPFWYDPARDLLLALDNLKKFTLIGPPSGIPGIFYGPYWIWFLSIPLLVSKDPRFVVLVVLGIPYLILFPVLAIKSKIYSNFIIRIGMISLFLLSYPRYGIFLWNPNLAPFLFFLLFIVLFSGDQKKIIRFFAGGLITGAIVMVHISFGVGIAAATILYLFFESLCYEKNNISKLPQKLYGVSSKMFFFILGVLISFSPFLIFESRHGWNQIKAFVKTTLDSVLYNSSVVGQKGLSHFEIIKVLFKVPQELFSISITQFGFIFIIFLLLGVIFFHISNSLKRTKYARMVQFLSLSIILPMCIYLSSKNPVWDYHFIGFEMIFLLMTGIFLEKIKFLRYLFFLWIIILVIFSVRNTIQSIQGNTTVVSGLALKEEAVKIIKDDANDQSINYFAYSPSIYTYDYDYLFMWLIPKKTSSTVGVTPIYLIIPKSSEAITLDFINYRTPNGMYHTEKRWDLPDKTIILKRVKTSL